MIWLMPFMITVVTLLNHLIPVLKSFKLVTLSENFIKKCRGKVDSISVNVNACILILSTEIECSLKKWNFPLKILNFQQSWNGIST